MSVFDTEIIHKRRYDDTHNGTLCGKDGFAVYNSQRISCKECKEIIEKDTNRTV